MQITSNVDPDNTISNSSEFNQISKSNGQTNTTAMPFESIRQSIITQLEQIKQLNISAPAIQSMQGDENHNVKIVKTINKHLNTQERQLVLSGQIITLNAQIKVKEDQILKLEEDINSQCSIGFKLKNEQQQLESLEVQLKSDLISYPLSISKFRWIKSIRNPSSNTYLIYSMMLVLLNKDLLWDNVRTLNNQDYLKLMQLKYSDISQEIINKLELLRIKYNPGLQTSALNKQYEWACNQALNYEISNEIILRTIEVNKLQTEYDDYKLTQSVAQTKLFQIRARLEYYETNQLERVKQCYKKTLNYKLLSNNQRMILNSILMEIQNELNLGKLQDEYQPWYINLQQIDLELIYSKEWLEAIIEMQPQSEQQPIQFKMLENLQDPYLYSSILLVKGVGDLKIEQLNQQMNKIINRQILVCLIDYYSLVRMSAIDQKLQKIFKNDQLIELNRLFHQCQVNTYINKLLMDNIFKLMIRAHKLMLKLHLLEYKNNSQVQFEYCDNNIRYLAGKAIRYQTKQYVIKLIECIYQYSSILNNRENSNLKQELDELLSDSYNLI